MIRISIARLACVVVALGPLPLASSFGPARPAPALAAAPAAKPAAASAPGAADCAVERETFSKLPPEVALQVQDALAYFGLYGNRIDKIVGIDTRAGLAAYCRQHGMHLDNTPASHQALVDELLRDAAIDRIYHGWRGIIASPGFNPWASRQRDHDDIAAQLESGTPAEVTSIIDRYLKYQPDRPRPAPALEQDDQSISYSLSEADMKLLETRGEALARLARLKNGGFMEQAAFSAQVRDLLGAEAGSLPELIEQHADRMAVVSIGKEGMDRLRSARVPAYLLERLGELQDPGYPSRAEADKAIAGLPSVLKEALKDYRPVAGKAAPPAESSAESPPAETTPAPASPAPESTGDALADELSLRLEQSGSAGTPRQAAAFETIGRQLVAEAEKWLPLIQAQLEERSAYRLSEAAWNKLGEAVGAFPAYAVALIRQKGLPGLDYPLRELFAAAARTRMAEGLANMVRDDILKRRLSRLDDAYLAELKGNQGRLPPTLSEGLRALQGKEFGSPEALVAEVDKLLQKALDTFFEQCGNTLLGLARKPHRLDPAAPIAWAPVPGCKCLPAQFNDELYAFYPYWLSGNETREVDFGLVSRVGYYALGFDDGGAISDPGHWSEASRSAFEAARRYGTQVDLVVRRSDWSGWAAMDPGERRKAFAALAGNIATLLGIEPPGDRSGIQRYLSRGWVKPALGDGVTLFFQHYPDDPQAIQDFKGFLRQLNRYLQGTGRNVNIMLSRDELGKGIFEPRKLVDWARLISSKPAPDEELADQQDAAADEPAGKKISDDELASNTLILLLLKSPVTDDKKAVRSEIEKSLPAADRRTLLRMLVPVVVPDGTPALEDQVIYMGDNFAGLGLWPLPGRRFWDERGGIIRTEYFLPSPSSGIRSTTIQTNPVCGIVCPNRWGFRVALGVFGGVSLLVLGAFLLCCTCRDNFRRHFILYLAIAVVPLLLTGMALLTCDPGLEHLAEGNIPLFLVLLGIVGYAVWAYRERGREVP